MCTINPRDERTSTPSSQLAKRGSVWVRGAATVSRGSSAPPSPAALSASKRGLYSVRAPVDAKRVSASGDVRAEFIREKPRESALRDGTAIDWIDG